MNVNPDELARAQRLLAEAEGRPAPSLDLDALISAARDNLKLKPVKLDDKAIEAPDADLVNTLLAHADDYKRQIDALTKERSKITDLLAEIMESEEERLGLEAGGIEGLTVHGATVFTNKVSRSRVLNAAHIKSLFPDIAGNEECYTDQIRRTRLYK
jgi:hypothetical protein